MGLIAKPERYRTAIETEDTGVVLSGDLTPLGESALDHQDIGLDVD